MQLTQEQEKKLKRIAKLVDFETKGAVVLIEDIFALEDEFGAKIPELKELVEELSKERPDRDEIKEIVSEIVGKVIPEKGDKGDDGEDYILTEQDKKEIASLIEVPKPKPDKIIEKTETIIKEQPIEIIKEVAIIDKTDLTKEGEAIRDGLELLQDDDRLDKKAIKGLEDYEQVSKNAFEANTRVISNTRNFYQLLDAPEGGYIGQAGKVLKVKTSENGLEWGADSDAQDLQSVTDLGSTTTNTIQLPAIQALTSAGGTIKSHSGSNVAEFGAGGGQNWTFEDGVKLNAGTASRVLLTDASKNIAYSTLTATDLEAIPTSYLKLDQTTPQTISGGIPNFSAGLQGSLYDNAVTPALSIDTNSRQLIDKIGTGILIDWTGFGGTAAGVLNFGVGSDIAYHPYFSTAITDTYLVNSIDPNVRALYDDGGSQIAGWGAGESYGFHVYGGLQVDNIFPTGSYVDFGSGGDVSIQVKDIYAGATGGMLYDRAGNPIFNFSNEFGGGLLSGNGQYGIDFNSAGLVDTTTVSLNWQYHYLYTTTSDGGSDYGISVNWQTQQLYSVSSSTSTISLDWKARKFYDTTGVEIGEWGGANGNIKATSGDVSGVLGFQSSYGVYGFRSGAGDGVYAGYFEDTANSTSVILTGQVATATPYAINATGNTLLTGALNVTGLTTLDTALTGLLRADSGVVSADTNTYYSTYDLDFFTPIVLSPAMGNFTFSKVITTAVATNAWKKYNNTITVTGASNWNLVTMYQNLSSAGTIKLGANESFRFATISAISSSYGMTLDLNGYTHSMNMPTGIASSYIIDNTSASLSTVTITASGSVAPQMAIRNTGGGGINIIHNGTGTVTWSSIPTHTANFGTYTVNSSATVGDANPAFLNAVTTLIYNSSSSQLTLGTTDRSAKLRINNGYNVNIYNNSANCNMDTAFGLNAAGGNSTCVLNFLGSTTTNYTNLGGNNVWSGGTYLGPNAHIRIGHDNALGTGTTLSLASGPWRINAVGADRTVPQKVAFIAGSSTLTFDGTYNLTFAGASSTNAVAQTISVTAKKLTFAGAISGPYLMTKTGAGEIYFKQLAGGITVNGGKAGCNICGGALTLANTTGVIFEAVDHATNGIISTCTTANFGGSSARVAFSWNATNSRFTYITASSTVALATVGMNFSGSPTNGVYDIVVATGTMSGTLPTVATNTTGKTLALAQVGNTLQVTVS